MLFMGKSTIPMAIFNSNGASGDWSFGCHNFDQPLRATELSTPQTVHLPIVLSYEDSPIHMVSYGSYNHMDSTIIRFPSTSSRRRYQMVSSSTIWFSREMWICRLTPIKKGHVRRKMMLFNQWIWRLWARFERSKSSGQEKSSEIWSRRDLPVNPPYPHWQSFGTTSPAEAEAVKVTVSPSFVRPDMLGCTSVGHFFDPKGPAASLSLSPSSFQSLLATSPFFLNCIERYWKSIVVQNPLKYSIHPYTSIYILCSPAITLWEFNIAIFHIAIHRW